MAVMKIPPQLAWYVWPCFRVKKWYLTIIAGYNSSSNPWLTSTILVLRSSARCSLPRRNSLVNSQGYLCRIIPNLTTPDSILSLFFSFRRPYCSQRAYYHAQSLCGLSLPISFHSFLIPFPVHL